MKIIRPFKIGKLIFKNNLVLAPMAAVCLKPFRLKMKQMGAGLVSNEMVSSYGVCYENQKTWDMLDVFDEVETPVSVQVFGSDPHYIAEAAKRLVDKGVEIVDINMGCPSPKLTNGGAGSALLKDPKKVQEVVKKAREAIGSLAALTVKIRAGWDLSSINSGDIAAIIEGEGADAISIHARTKTQKFKDYDWGVIKDVKDRVNIPVIGNGNLMTPYDVKQMYDETNCDAFMIGRATQSNPWIFKQTLEYFEKGTITEASDKERIEYILTFARDFVAYRGDHGIFEVRKFIVWLTKAMKNSASLRKDFFEIRSLADVDLILERYNKNL